MTKVCYTLIYSRHPFLSCLTICSYSEGNPNGYQIDETIMPRPGFQKAFEEIIKTFHMVNEAARRIFLNLFLSDIVLRPEFEGVLRIFPKFVMSVNPKDLRNASSMARRTIPLALEKARTFLALHPLVNSISLRLKPKPRLVKTTFGNVSQKQQPFTKLARMLRRPKRTFGVFYPTLTFGNSSILTKMVSSGALWSITSTFVSTMKMKFCSFIALYTILSSDALNVVLRPRHLPHLAMFWICNCDIYVLYCAFITQWKWQWGDIVTTSSICGSFGCILAHPIPFLFLLLIRCIILPILIHQLFLLSWW